MNEKKKGKSSPITRALAARGSGEQPVLDEIVLEFFFDPVGNDFRRVMKTRDSFADILKALKFPFLAFINDRPHEFFPDPWKKFEHMQAGCDGVGIVEELYKSFFFVPYNSFKDEG